MGTAVTSKLDEDVELTPALLGSGVPTLGSYEAVLHSPLFKKIETFSNQFVISECSILQPYARKWVPDPLHQWSRQWEYPFAYVHIKKWLSEQIRDHVTVLDAGSGITFFPFLIASSFPNVSVTCCDMDSELEPWFASISRRLSIPIEFTNADLHELPYSDASYDIVYSVSVLEHTEDYATIFRELRRILRPGGIVIVTFDVSLDRANRLIDENARRVMQTAEEFFRPVGKATLESALNNPGVTTSILTTRYAQELNKDLLPWKYSYSIALKRLLRGQSPLNQIPNLTCFCEVLTAI
jgi:2-polyprenyl-3-methyl-5-hydroxy-6-metoxy-1,4-benzoquinol methylase